MNTIQISLRVEQIDALRIRAMAPEIAFTEGADGWDATASAVQVLAAADLMDASNDDALSAIAELAGDLRAAVRAVTDAMTAADCKSFWLANVGHDEIEATGSDVYDYLCEMAGV